MSRGQFLLKDRNAKIAGLDPLSHANLEDLEDLLDRSAGFERILNVPPCSWRVHVGVRGVEGDAEELDLLLREDAAPREAGARIAIVVVDFKIRQASAPSYFPMN